MQIKTILNRVQKFKSFVYGAVRLVEGAAVPTLEVEVQPRANSRPLCRGCGHRRPGYDQAAGAALRVCAAVGHQGVFPLCTTPGGLSRLRGSGGADAVGGRQASADRGLCLVSGALGQAPELEGGGRGLPHHLGSRVPVGGTGGDWGREHQDLSGDHAIGVDEMPGNAGIAT